MRGVCGVRIAPGDEGRHDESLRLFPESQGAASLIGDLAAGSGDDRMSRGDIPFRGWPEPRVDVGSALGDRTELDRRAKLLPHRPRPAIDKGLGPWVSM